MAGIEPALDALSAKLADVNILMEDFNARWLTVKLMENDAEARRIVQHHTHNGHGLALAEQADEMTRKPRRSRRKKLSATVIVRLLTLNARLIVNG